MSVANLFIANRTKAASIIFHDINAGDSFLTAKQATNAVGVIVSLICIFFLARSSRALWRKQAHKPITHRILRFLICQSIISLMCTLSTLFILNVHLSWQACAYFGPIPPLLYGAIKALSNELMYLRAQSTLSKTAANAQIILKMTRMMIINVAVCLPYLYFVWTGRYIFHEEICVSVLDVSKWLMYFFALADLNMSGALLMLFVIPLYHQVRSVVSDSGSKIRKVAKRNILLSSVAMISAMILLYPLGAGISAPTDVSSRQHLMLFPQYGVLVDLNINLVVNFAMFHKLFASDKKVAISASQNQSTLPFKELTPSRVQSSVRTSAVIQ